MDSSELDLYKFSKLLQEKLALIGEEPIIRELHEWGETAFTTSSELMGEMKLILKKVYGVKNIDKVTKKNVKHHIAAINKALRHINL